MTVYEFLNGNFDINLTIHYYLIEDNSMTWDMLANPSAISSCGSGFVPDKILNSRILYMTFDTDKMALVIECA